MEQYSEIGINRLINAAFSKEKNSENEEQDEYDELEPTYGYKNIDI